MAREGGRIYVTGHKKSEHVTAVEVAAAVVSKLVILADHERQKTGPNFLT